jgi:hypothetical protein
MTEQWKMLALVASGSVGVLSLACVALAARYLWPWRSVTDVINVEVFVGVAGLAAAVVLLARGLWRILFSIRAGRVAYNLALGWLLVFAGLTAEWYSLKCLIVFDLPVYMGAAPTSRDLVIAY